MVIFVNPVGYIDLRKALKNLLREHGVTLQDVLSLMDEEKGGIIDALKKRIHLTDAQCKSLERNLSSRDLNLLLFVVQTFYIVNPGGLYKGLIIEPRREDVMGREKVTFEGCKMILEALRISTENL